MSTREGGSGFFAGFILGGLVGAAAALLLTPRSGEETRESLMDRGIVLKVKAEEVASRAKEEADELIARGKTVLEDQKSRLKEAVEEGKEAAAEKKAELLARYRVAKATGETPEQEPSRMEPPAPESPRPGEEPESGTQQG